MGIPELQKGAPEVMAGWSGLDKEVRWVHISEIPDVARYLRGGELILATGTGLPHEPDELKRYVHNLASAGAAGVVIGLRRKFPTVPPAMSAAADERALPLILLHAPIPFVDVTEVVHLGIIHARERATSMVESVGSALTELSVQGARPAELVSEIARLMECPVVLEDMAHQVVAFSASEDETGEVLTDWELKSRQVSCESGWSYDDDQGWLVSVVSARDQYWGRLVAVTERQTPGTLRLLEHGASAIAINCLIGHQRAPLLDQGQVSLLEEIVAGSHSTPATLFVRAEAVGVPLRDRLLLGVVVSASHAGHPFDSSGVDGDLKNRELLLRTRQATRLLAHEDVSALIGFIDIARVGMVLSLPPLSDESDVLEELTGNIHRLLAATAVGSVSIGVSSQMTDIRDLRRGLLQAQQASEAGWGSPRRYVQLRDVHARGLVQMLRNDGRLVEFVERELGALEKYDQERRGDLLATLRHLLEVGGNKSEAASSLGISRPSLYQRLKRIEILLGVDLDDAETRTSLHLALLAREMAVSRSAGS